jgi:hypothetical protein
MLRLLRRKRKCLDCGGVTRQVRSASDTAWFLVQEVLFWGGLALLAFGAEAAQYVGGASVIASVAVLFWLGARQSKKGKCSSCGADVERN